MSMIAFDRLLLRTAFCCMASDGNIDKREIAVIQSLCMDSDQLKGLDCVDTLNQFVKELNLKGKQFIVDYLDILNKSDFSEQEELQLIEIAIKTIYADEQVEYSEIKFFKTIRHRLKVSNEEILELFPEIEMFLENDILSESILDKITSQYFDIAKLPLFDFIDISDNNED